MTFEDFINQERPWLQNLNQIEQYKLVWNAAIASAINKIETKKSFFIESPEISPTHKLNIDIEPLPNENNISLEITGK